MHCQFLQFLAVYTNNDVNAFHVVFNASSNGSGPVPCQTEELNAFQREADAMRHCQAPHPSPLVTGQPTTNAGATPNRSSSSIPRLLCPVCLQATFTRRSDFFAHLGKSLSWLLFYSTLNRLWVDSVVNGSFERFVIVTARLSLWLH